MSSYSVLSYVFEDHLNFKCLFFTIISNLNEEENNKKKPIFHVINYRLLLTFWIIFLYCSKFFYFEKEIKERNIKFINVLRTNLFHIKKKILLTIRNWMLVGNISNNKRKETTAKTRTWQINLTRIIFLIALKEWNESRYDQSKTTKTIWNIYLYFYIFISFSQD